jgi:dihydrofolate reductase
MGAIIVDILSRADAFLLGRGTYEIFAAHWPRITDTQDPVASKLNALPKHVASRTRASFDWQASSPMRDVAADVAKLKQRYAGEIQVHGSPGLAQTLIEHDLVDEYRFFIFPVVLGAGKRLFGRGALPTTLSLQQSRATSTGAIYCVYRRAGALKTGSFALE